MLVIAWALALALVGPPTAPAAAEGRAPSVALTWHAPSGCPTESQVMGAIERLVGEAPAPGGSPAAAEATVHAVADRGYIVDLEVVVPTGKTERTAAGRTCQEVADATAVLVASLVSPDAVAASVHDPLEPVAPPPDDAPLLRHPIRGFVRVFGAASYGVLPGWGGGPGLAGGIDYGRVRFEARTFVDAPQRVTVAGTSASVSFIAWSGALVGCFVPGRGTLTFPLCLGPELAWVRGASSGFEQNRVAHRLLVDVVGGAALSYAPVKWLALRAELDGLVVLTPGRFVIDDVGQLHRIRTGGIRLGIGVELRFGHWRPRARTEAS